MSRTADILRKTYEDIRDEHRQYANTATRIGNAFLSLLSYLLDEGPYISKEHDDITQYVVNFLAGIKAGDDVTIKDGTAELKAVKSKQFLDGFFGSGFKLWESDDKKTHLTIDTLTVREKAVFFELLISKVRAVDGQLVISAAQGKIDSVRDEGDFYHIYFKDNNPFVAHDLIRCSRLDGRDLRDYWVEVSEADANSIRVAYGEFSGQLPKPDDECVLMGNTSDTARQNLIVLSASEDGQPHIDVLSGVKSKTFAGCIKSRLGNLDGIHDDALGDRQPKDDGLYCNNAYLVGDFILRNGDNVQTRFELTDKNIEASVEALRHDMTYDENFLDNADFSALMTNWDTDNQAAFYLLGTNWIWANNNVLSDRGDFSRVERDGARKVLHIHNNFIKQFNRNFIKRPDFEIDPETGSPVMIPIYLSFFYKCTKAGELTANFSGADVPIVGGERFFFKKENIAVTDDYEQFTYTGLWNGTGDFRIAFTGDILISMLVLTTDKTEGLAYKYRTLFEQSDRLVRLSAGIYDKNEECLKESGLVIKPEGSGMYAQDADGNLALVGVTVTKEGKSVVMLTADNIKLEGLVTANNYFKILADGSIEATNGKFTGKITCTEGTIGGFNIGKDHIGMAKGEGAGSLSIYQDYFCVGGPYGYGLIGHDVSSSTNSAKTISKIFNQQYNEEGYNYGMVIDVQSGIRNFGISSNAAIMAPAMIATKAKNININPTSITEMDFSQYNIFLIFATEYLGVTLPSEDMILQQFGLKSLPSDFALIITIKLRSGSSDILLKNVYNEDESIKERRMAAGDSIMLLVSKMDGFRYNVINFSS